MRSSTVVLALFFSLALACSKSSTPGGGDADTDAEADGGPVADAGPTHVIPPFVVPNCAEDDADEGTATFSITTVEIPRVGTPQMPPAIPVGGFDIDSLDSTELNIDGCFALDFDDGVDNAFAHVAATLNLYSSVFDIDVYDAVAELIADGQLAISVELARWNGERDDDLVEVRVTVTAGSLSQESVGCGALVDGTLEGGFPMELTINLGIGLPLALTIWQPRFRLVLDEDASAIDPTLSYLGGYLLWDDGTPLNRPGELRAQLETLFTLAVGESLAYNILNGIGDSMDLDGYPELRACSFDEEGAVTADSMSIGLRIGGERD